MKELVRKVFDNSIAMFFIGYVLGVIVGVSK